MRINRKHRLESLIVLTCMTALLVTGCSDKGERSLEEEEVEDTEEPTATVMATTKQDKQEYDFNICFAGDMNFSEDWATMEYYNTCENGIRDCISADLIEDMQNADIMCVNNEFTYSNGGTPLENKAYTFRANPSRVGILNELGVDLVTLANNHVYDYGEEALCDTFDTLENAGIKYFGAGHNLEEAMTPCYIEIDGKTIAFVAASRAEKYKMTPQATEDEPGILRCYDTTLFKQEIEMAKENADFVIAYIHWGTEGSDQLDDEQLSTAREYMDAGVDVIIGAHPHCLQGMEYYDGKPIIYSMGNFWFNDKTMDTMILQLHFSGDTDNSNLEVKVIPAIQSECKTTGVTEISEKERIYSYLEDISENVQIDQNGIITEED